MAFKDQLTKLKDNWLLIAIITVVLLFTFGSNMVGNFSRSMGMSDQMESLDYSRAKMASAPAPGGGFAPEVEVRKITKSASIANEVERGEFYEAEGKLKNIVQSSSSYILNQNVNRHGKDNKVYHRGYYTLKINSEKYDSVIDQLKDIGEVTSFNENAQDITASYTNTEIEIETEKTRLDRYENLFSESIKMSDKLDLTDRIFNQERKIKYMQDSLKNMDNRVDYSTISVTLNEKMSDYISVVFVKFSELIKILVGSYNMFIRLVFVLLPWGIAAVIIKLAINFLKKKKK